MPDSIKVLDHGFVSLIDHLGDDKRVTDAARISYATDKPEFDNRDIGLIRYLMRHHHWTPFEMVHFTFRMKMPIFVARQMIRHRTANVNEMSARYTELPNEMYLPEPGRLNLQSTNNKQGSSSETLDDSGKFLVHEGLKSRYESCYDFYDACNTEGLSKELSRICLPVATYTEWYWTMDLRNLFNFLRLRLDSHAQYEIRVYADAVYELIKPIVPHSCKAFEDYILNSVTLSSMETKIVDALIGIGLPMCGKKVDKSDLERLAGIHLSKIEWDEFKVKLEKLGVKIDDTKR